MSVPDFRMHAVQGKILLAEMRHLVHVRRTNQPAVEPVGPGVIGALDAARKRARGVSVHSRVPRCRQTLWNACTPPSADRVMMTLSPATSRSTN